MFLERHRTPAFLPWLYPSLQWRGPTSQHMVYLTFDDGPAAGPTDFVLDVLGRFRVKATFFIIGDNAQRHDELLGRMIREGHALGNHTMNHSNGWQTPLSEYLENVGMCEAVLATHVKKRPRLFRPPYGRITRRQIAGLQDYQIVMWDVLSMDYRHDLSPERCLTGTRRAVRPGSIVVFHDSHKAERSLHYAFPRLVESLLQDGYSFGVLN